MKILISCDYSASGEHVLYEANKFLSAFPTADIHVFSVIDISVVSAGGMYNNTELLSSLELDAKELCKKAEFIFSGRKINFSTEVGYPAETVLQMATKLPADLLVLGTHGRTGLDRIVIGSVAESILRRAPCNTLVIPVKHKDREQTSAK